MCRLKIDGTFFHLRLWRHLILSSHTPSKFRCYIHKQKIAYVQWPANCFTIGQDPIHSKLLEYQIHAFTYLIIKTHSLNMQIFSDLKPMFGIAHETALSNSCLWYESPRLLTNLLNDTTWTWKPSFYHPSTSKFLCSPVQNCLFILLPFMCPTFSCITSQICELP